MNHLSVKIREPQPTENIMATKKTEPFHFEQALTQLTELVEKMEQGKLPLEQSLQYFEQGIGLVRDCQKALQEAERKVQILTQTGQEALADFSEDDDDTRAS